MDTTLARTLARSVAITAAAALAMSTAGCSSSAASPAAAPPTVTGAWVRPPMGMGGPAAAYMTISNPSDRADALVGASSPAAGSVEIHRTSTDASGMTGMSPVSRVELPAGGTVTLAPGGMHLMVMRPTATLQVGATFELDLTFERAGRVVVQAEVRGG